MSRQQIRFHLAFLMHMPTELLTLADGEITLGTIIKTVCWPGAA